MADTFSNDLRLRLQESGSNAGTWGDLLNGTITNIASGFGQGSEAIPNASTHTITLADGAADEARSLYLKCTGGGQACTVTLGPNTISKVWIIDNATSYTLTFSQGSGANVAIAAGAVKVIATDGAGSGAAVVDTLDGLEGSLSTLAVTGALAANGGAVFNEGSADVDFRVESDGNTHALFVDGGNNHVNIGTATDLGSLFNVGGASNFNGPLIVDPNTAGKTTFSLSTNAANDARLQMRSDTTVAVDIQANGASYFNGGDVGIGSAPSNLLHLHNTSGDSIIRMSGGGSLGINYGGFVNGYSVSGTGGYLDLGVIDANAFRTAIQIKQQAAEIIFKNGDTERMRLSGGNLLVGTTATVLNSKANFVKASTTSSALVINAYNSAASNTGRATNAIFRGAVQGSGADVHLVLTDSVANNYFFGGNNAGTWVATNSNGVRLSNGGTSWASDSDERLKDIIEPIENGLEKVSTLRSVIGKYKTDEEDKRRVFLIAQDVQAVLPEAVFENEGTLMLQYTDLIPLCIKALQEAQTRIETLEAKVQTLENN